MQCADFEADRGDAAGRDVDIPRATERDVDIPRATERTGRRSTIERKSSLDGVGLKQKGTQRGAGVPLKTSSELWRNLGYICSRAQVMMGVMQIQMVAGQDPVVAEGVGLLTQATMGNVPDPAALEAFVAKCG